MSEPADHPQVVFLLDRISDLEGDGIRSALTGIVVLHTPCQDWSYGDPSTCPELRALSRAFRHHPAYRPAWGGEPLHPEALERANAAAYVGPTTEEH